jgi:hypothetical protein
MTVIIDGTLGVSGVAGTASAPALIGTDADSGFYINSANEPNASVNGTAAWSAASSFGFKNRIINGGMVIDQRNAGASVSISSGAPAAVYTVDRWQIYASQNSKFTIQQNAGSVTPPAGYSSYLGATSSSAYTLSATDQFFIAQYIEGYNIADFGFGAAGAQSVTLSFWVRSSLTGAFGGCVSNGALSRNYPFGFTINAANTWEQKTVTVAGDTSGTWVSNNASGMRVEFSLGTGSTYQGTANAWTSTLYLSAPTGATNMVSTNGATFYITGVQLEKGSTATSFDFRSYGTELILCQRYCQVFGSGAGTYENFGMGMTTSTTNSNVFFPYVVSMRTQPTVTTSGSFRVADFVNYSTAATIAINTDYTGLTAATFACTSTGLTSQRFAFLQANNDTTTRVKLSAEL